MAELRPYNPTIRDRLAQFLLGDSRASSFKGDVVEGLLGSTGLGNSKMGLADFTPAGMAFSAEDAGRSLANGNYGQAALDAMGAIPSGVVASGISKVKNAAKSTDFLASKSADIYTPPIKPQRPFEADYPKGAIADEKGNLQFDIEGRPRTAEVVVGRRRLGGEDEALSPAELDSLAEKILGRRPAVVAPSTLPRGSVGKFDPNSGQIAVSNRLDSAERDLVLGHEFGHGLNHAIGPYEGRNQPRNMPPARNSATELKTVYNDLNNPKLNAARQQNPNVAPENVYWGTGVTPQSHFGYSDKEAPGEYMAEAFRAYLTDPNYLKTVAPRTAQQIRKSWNSHPTLSKILQFNSLAAMGGAGALAMGGGDDASAAEMPSYGPRMDAASPVGFPGQQSKTKQRIRSMITGPDELK